MVWRTEDSAVDWFALSEGRYVPMRADDHGILKSRLFPGLWLDVPAMLNADLPTLMSAVDRGVATTTEHAELLNRLRA